MPHDLLALLTETPQRAERLAARLGVTRESVAERAQRLQEDGVPVLICEQGYALAPGTPTEAALRPRGVFGRAYRYLGTVESTQDEVRGWAGAPHGAVVLAERQTRGRGRRGRAWESHASALTFSVLLAGGRPLPDLALVPLAAGVALREACGAGSLKWPNDLLAPDGRKLAGVLLEADLRGEQVRRAVLGIGLNVSGAPPGAASLAELLEVRRVDVLRDVLAALEAWLAASPREVLAAWRARNLTLGREVRIRARNGEVRGLALDLASDGALLIDTGSGLARIGAGDVELVTPLSPDAMLKGVL